MKLKKLLIDNKYKMNPEPKKGKEKIWADNMVNLLYSLASNRPTNFGVYARYARDEIEELLSHYENDLCEAT